MPVIVGVLDERSGGREEYGRVGNNKNQSAPSLFPDSEVLDIPSPPIFAECDDQEYECEWQY